MKEKIHLRLRQRYPKMLEETINLNKAGLSWERLESFGLEYRWMARLARSAANQGKNGQETKAERDALQNLERDIITYARRQLTWWRKHDVIWIKNYTEAKSEVTKFLKK